MSVKEIFSFGLLTKFETMWFKRVVKRRVEEYFLIGSNYGRVLSATKFSIGSFNDYKNDLKMRPGYFF